MNSFSPSLLTQVIFPCSLPLLTLASPQILASLHVPCICIHAGLKRKKILVDFSPTCYAIFRRRRWKNWKRKGPYPTDEGSLRLLSESQWGTIMVQPLPIRPLETLPRAKLPGAWAWAAECLCTKWLTLLALRGRHPSPTIKLLISISLKWKFGINQRYNKVNKVTGRIFTLNWIRKNLYNEERYHIPIYCLCAAKFLKDFKIFLLIHNCERL